MSETLSFAATSNGAAAIDADSFAFAGSAFADPIKQSDARIGTAPVTIPLDVAGALWKLVDLLAAAPLETVEALLSAMLDGMALGRTESAMPEAEDLPKLAGDLTAALEGDEAATAFDIGRSLGKASAPVEAMTEGLPDPAGLGKEGADGAPSAMDALTKSRDGLQETFGPAVEHPSLMGSGRGVSGTDSADSGSTANDAQAAAKAETEAEPAADGGSPPTPLEPDDAIDYGDVAVAAAGVAISLSVVAAGITVTMAGAAATPAIAAVTLALAAGSLAVSAVALVASEGGWRPTDDTPSAAETEMSLEEFFAAVAEKVGGLVLTSLDDPSAVRPEDMAAFEANLRQALWDTVSRPADTGDTGGEGGGLDPEELQHKLDPDTEIDSPLPDDVNPYEPIDPTGGGGTGAGESDLIL